MTELSKPPFMTAAVQKFKWQETLVTHSAGEVLYFASVNEKRRIWDSHGSEHEDSCLLGCSAT
jgi:hypothetical protein